MKAPEGLTLVPSIAPVPEETAPEKEPLKEARVEKGPEKSEKPRRQTKPKAARPQRPRAKTRTRPKPVSQLPAPRKAKRVKVSGHVSAETKDLIDAFVRAQNASWSTKYLTIQSLVESAYDWFFVEMSADMKQVSRSCMGKPPYNRHLPIRVTPELAEKINTLPEGQKGKRLDAIIATFVLQVAPNRSGDDD